MGNLKIKIKPLNRVIEADADLSLFENCRNHKIYIESYCGGNGLCGKCKVKVIDGERFISDIDKNHLSKAELQEGWRLACQMKIDRDTEIFIPQRLLVDTEHILTEGSHVATVINPKVKKYFLQLAPQTIQKPLSDTSLIAQKLTFTGGIRFHNSVLAKLPTVLREAKYFITVTLYGNEVIDIEKGNTVSQNYGIAFDLGTSTVVGSLINLNSGKQVAIDPAINPQNMYGADIISRIQYCRQNKTGISELKNIIAKLFERLIEDLCKDATVNKKNVYELVVVGNPTMMHLFLGLNPAFIGEMPYVPVFSEAVESPKISDDNETLSSFPVEVPPNLSGFIGSDTVSGIISQGLLQSDKIQLFIDIGSNAEIVLGDKRRLLISNAAAGPAFEGGKIECGMSGLRGAIDSFSYDKEDIVFTVIDAVQPQGICGSGLVDIVAALLELKIIDPSGKFVSEKNLDKKIPSKIRSRLRYDSADIKFYITEKIYISQKDIREIQAAKAAIAAGINILEKKLEIEDKDIEKVLLAGAFGNYIKPSSAQKIGLIPKISLKKVISVGNTALEGAKMYLVSTDVRKLATEISEKVELHELSAEPDFMDEFASQMPFSD